MPRLDIRRFLIPTSGIGSDSEDEITYVGRASKRSTKVTEVPASDSESGFEEKINFRGRANTKKSTPKRPPRRSRTKTSASSHPSRSTTTRHSFDAQSCTVDIKSDSGDSGELRLSPPRSGVPLNRTKAFAPESVPLSDPRSSIWKGREGSNIAVVICSSRKQSCGLSLGVSSASRQNAIAAKRTISENGFTETENDEDLDLLADENHHYLLPHSSSTASPVVTAKRKKTNMAAPRNSSTNQRNTENYSDDSPGDGTSDTQSWTGVSDDVDSSDGMSLDETESSAESDSDGRPQKKVKLSSTYSIRQSISKAPILRPVTKAVTSSRKTLACKASKAKVPEASKEKCDLNYVSDEDLNELGERLIYKATKYTDNYQTRNGVAEDLPPLSTVAEMFNDLTEKIKVEGFCNVTNRLNHRPLNIATMCSGTESPILALILISQNLKKDGINLNLNHIFSAEIVPWKQQYIERNFHPPIIFSDIVELSLPNPNPSMPRTATTAYGGKAEVPNNVDLLIAGFCCVDFSMLNNGRKALDHRGESGDTFFSMRDYANEYRPKIIILENVSGAPWQDSKLKNSKTRGIDFRMKEVGYSSRFVRMDTKDYYIPHTRVRGYMVCIDERAYPNSRKLDAMLEKWENLVKKLKRPASIPAEALLLADDDPLLNTAWSEGNDQNQKVIHWEKCKGGHHDYRSALGLGNKRTLTNWTSAGSRILPDYFKKTKGFSERVLDTLDIAHLRNIVRGFDDRYYSRIFELSQNVFRVTDTTKNGHIGCLTPTGMPFSSVRGGRVNGFEAVTLQGLPLEQIDVSQLTQSNLQDLAGNAMSSTVVGVALLAALSVFYEVLEPGEGTMQVDEPELDSNLEGEDLLVQKTSNSTTYLPLSVETALAEAASTVRLCSCEGRHDKFSAVFQQCQVCKHTACVNCGKNPKHHYVMIPQHVINSRKDPAVFQELIKRSIPMTVSFADINSRAITEELKARNNLSIDSRTCHLVTKAIDLALGSEVYFRTVRRAESWQVTYDCSSAKLVLLISRNSVEWLLYAKVSPEEPGNSPLRMYLQQFPFARMIPNGDDITKGTWSFWLPEKRKLDAVITGKGKLVPSFESTRGLAVFADTFVWSSIFVHVEEEDVEFLEDDIRGEYELSQDCGQAFNSMHVRIDTKGFKKPSFFYFDHPLRTGDPKKHSFVFTHDKRRLNYGEHRPIVARACNSWRQPKIQGVPTVDSFEFKADTSGKLVHESQLNSKQATTIFVDGRWVDLSGGSFNLSNQTSISYRHLPGMPYLSNNSCQSSQAIFICEVSIPGKVGPSWPRNVWTLVGKANEASFFQEFRWMLERGLVIDGHRHDNHYWQVSGTDGSVSRCLSCAPEHPKMLWTFNSVGKQVPFEEPLEGSEYERTLKNRPSPITIMLHIDDADKIQLKIGTIPETLIHRATARLLVGRSANTVMTSWRLITDDVTTSKPQLGEFKLKNNDKEAEARQPPNFVRKYGLRPEQLRCLTWMIRQEQSPQIFTEEEVVEVRAPQIGYRVEGKAAQQVVARGGVQAQDVGFGKTATILGLIDSRLQADLEVGSETVAGVIPLKATIIFVPPQLPDQWAGEVRKFLPGKKASEVLVIKNFQKLKGLTIADFQKAHIIIVNWRICEGDLYTFLLAQFTGMVETYDSASSRAKLTWYQNALQKIAENVDELRTNAAGLKWKIDNDYKYNVEETESVFAPIPSKRTKGANYVNLEDRQFLISKGGYHKKTGKTTGESHIESECASESRTKTTSKKRKKVEDESKLKPRPDVFMLKDLAKGKSWKTMKSPVFEMFRFARIVIDEYTYVTGNEARVMEKLKANSRWVLSGTPPLGGFTDVKMMAKFIGINLGVDDFSTLKQDAFRIATNELSSSEKFLTYQTAPSPAWQDRRHVHASKFLEQFVRKDVADIKKIEYSEHLRLVYQPGAERAIYLELMQRLAATDFKPKRSRPTGSDIDRQIEDALAGCEDGKEALLLRAAHFTLMEDNAQQLPEGLQDAAQACEYIVRTRQRQYEELKEVFQKALKQAQWLQQNKEAPCPNFESWKARTISTNHYGDSEASSEIEKFIEKAKRNYSKNDWMLFYRKDDANDENSHLQPFPEGMNDSHGTSHLYRKVAALRTATTGLNRLAEELVNRKRSLRFFQAVCTLQSLATKLSKGGMLGSGLKCEKCNSQGLLPHEVTILGQCGHLICNSACLPMERDDCPLSVCEATNETYQKIPGTELGTGTSSDEVSQHGKKLDEIVDLIHNIPVNDKVLLFVQFPKLLDKVHAALRSNCIPFADLNTGSAASMILSEFQQSDASKRAKKSETIPAKVLVLNIGDASAAGSNLTMANHVIFVSPYHTRGSSAQQTYDAAMTQAIGRARRYGQEKHVHIYHFLTTKTVDIDIVEERHSKIVKVGLTSTQKKPHPNFVHSHAALIEPRPDEQSEFGSTVAAILFEANESD